MAAKKSKTANTHATNNNINPCQYTKRHFKLGIDTARLLAGMPATHASELFDDYNAGLIPQATCEQSHLMGKLADLTAQAAKVAEQLKVTAKRGYKGALMVDYEPL